MGRLSRKATVEKGRVPAYVTQTQREMRVDSAKLTSTARNTMRQIPPPSSWVPSQIQGRFPRRRGSSLSQSAPSGPPSSLPVSARASFLIRRLPPTVLFWDPHAANLLSSPMCSNVINDVHAKTVNLVNKIFQVISYVIQNLCVRERLLSITYLRRNAASHSRTPQTDPPSQVLPYSPIRSALQGEESSIP